MKTRGSPSAPPPVHVHVAESTPVHVHMRRSPSRTPQGKDAPVRGDGGRPKTRTPWIPPGRMSCRRDLGSYKSQTSRIQLQSTGGMRDQREAEEQDEELHGVSKSLSVLLREQGSSSGSKTSESRDQQRDADVLLRTLIEAEIDGVAVANQLTALKETIDGLAKEKRPSKLHSASLGRQQELLLEKIEMFDRTNHNLRDLLRDWSEYERESLLWSTEKDALMKSLADSEAEKLRLFAKLSNKEKEASKLAENLDFEKDNVKTSAELSKVLESSRSHLEAQLNQAEAEKARLEAQIQRMQQSQEQQRDELRVLQAELQTLRQQREEEEEQQREEERESLGLMTQRAERAEESARQLAEKLQEKETQLSQALSTSSDWCLRHSKAAAGKRQLQEETADLKLRITELSSRLRAAEEKSRAEREELRNQLHQTSAESATFRLENQTLRSELTSAEDKLGGLLSEARLLKSSLRKSDVQLEKYKKKVQQARLESEEHRLKLEAAQKEARELKVSLEQEKEQVRRELLARVQELEALPERLRRSEQQLRDAQEEAHVHERRNLEHHAALAEVRHKVEQQGAQLETFQQRNLLLQEENNVLKEKVHNLERKLEDMSAEACTSAQTVSLQEGRIRSLQLQLEEKSRECSAASRQLQQTLEDAQRQVDGSVQRVLAKEKASQSRALELQTQLSRAKSELSQLQRSKEDMERRFHTQLQNMKERLDQSDSTNRSLQNYVQFLKTSYGNVFGDSLMAS
ncbi:outer dense fiber protein 2b [Fundulus heteroclitus]|uniref:outer dense fiber protein 2b n=1 Tax=Fundulus heteroclitus TaxID=8078 RepID=UPI00165C30C5|nr:outer dense fiber protein 2b [Fundulus heteroclitus]